MKKIMTLALSLLLVLSLSACSVRFEVRNKNNSKFAFEQSLDLVDECTGACRVCKNKECIMKHQ